MTHLRRAIFLLIGLTSLGLGALGVFLPLLPTTPFILLAAFAFANSSDRLHQWLLDHNVFGPMIDNWRKYGAISRRAKTFSGLSMIVILVISWLMGFEGWIIGLQAAVLSCVLAFILSRPAPATPELPPHRSERALPVPPSSPAAETREAPGPRGDDA